LDGVEGPLGSDGFLILANLLLDIQMILDVFHADIARKSPQNFHDLLFGGLHQATSDLAAALG